MLNALSHRGPDGDGFWESPADERGHGAMLAHRRLSILDLSTDASQPMIDPTSGHVVVLNGEIYNYTELRKPLAAVGHRFKSSGDTAVMLRALSVGGAAAVAELRGMFAFGLWNSHSRQLMLARDPLGIKPLYIARNPDPAGEWSLMFASEVRSILASGLLGKPRLGSTAAASMAWNGFVVGPDTVVEGIESICPGEYRMFDGMGAPVDQQFYWSIPRNGDRPAISEPELSDVLQECVRSHLASDVPLGIFLSGGVDSSAVANLAQRASASPIHTFTLAFEEKEFDEGVFAKRIASAIGTEHRELLLTEQHFMDRLDDALDSLDQPTFDGLNSFYMSHAVRQAGFKVALVGTGGDEIFGGYTSFRDLPRLYRWSRMARWIPSDIRVGLARAAASLMQAPAGAIPQQTRWAKLPDIVGGSGDLLALYQYAYALFLPAFQQQLLTGPATSGLVEGLTRAMRDRLKFESQGRPALEAISVMEQRLFLGERLLRDTDCTSMSASIELRLPLVDHVLLEAAARVPDDQRYEPVGAKAMLRRIGLRGMDPALFDRPKSGFVLPYDRWLRSALGKKIDGILSDPEIVRPTGLDPQAVANLWRAFLDGAPGLYWSRVWAVFVFIRWCHRHKVYQ
jgi:asparagine synthase (glutamine-hydrolysing)